LICNCASARREGRRHHQRYHGGGLVPRHAINSYALLK
jgi:hypothetical protein